MSGFCINFGAMNPGMGFGRRFGGFPCIQAPIMVMPMPVMMMPVTMMNNPILNNPAINNPALNNSYVNNPMLGALLWNRLNAVGGMGGQIDPFALGYMFRDMDADGNGVVDMNERGLWTMRNGNFPLQAPFTADAFRNLFAQRDLNRDGLWNHSEFDGQPAAPGAVGSDSADIFNQMGRKTNQNSGANPITTPQNGQSQMPAQNPANPQTQGQTQTPSSQPNPANEQQQQQPQNPANPQTQNQNQTPGQQGAPENQTTPSTTDPTGGKTTNEDAAKDKDQQPAPPKQDDEAKKKADALKKAEDLKLRFAAADKLDGKEDQSIDLPALITVADANGDGLEAEEFERLAALLGLKTTYPDFRKARGTKLSDEEGVLKLIGSNDEGFDKKLGPAEFLKLNGINAAAEQDNPGSEDAGIEKADAEEREAAAKAEAQKTETPKGKPGYFAININKKHGVERDELTAFIAQFADAKSTLSAAAIKKMVEDLEWDKARNGRRFVPQLLKVKDGMTVDDIVTLMFDRLDGDKNQPKKNFGLVRGELGDLVQHKKKSKS